EAVSNRVTSRAPMRVGAPLRDLCLCHSDAKHGRCGLRLALEETRPGFFASFGDAVVVKIAWREVCDVGPVAGPDAMECPAPVTRECVCVGMRGFDPLLRERGVLWKVEAELQREVAPNAVF